jgi:hypothetical protein
MSKMLSAAVPLAFLLVACEARPPAKTGDTTSPVGPAAATAPATAEAKARVEVPETRFIHADPAELPNCDFARVLLKWDTSRAEKPVAVVEIYAGNAQSTPGRFASGGAVGEAETGLWVRSGSVFSLRDKASGAEIEKLVIGGPICPD